MPKIRSSYPDMHYGRIGSKPSINANSVFASGDAKPIFAGARWQQRRPGKSEHVNSDWTPLFLPVMK